MLNITKILKKMPPNWEINSAYCKIKSYKKIIDKQDKNPVILAIVYSTHDHNHQKKASPEMHRCYIKGLDGAKKKIYASNVEVSCDCKAFLYWCEVALEDKDASVIFFSNGEMPIVRNPKMIPFMCKHLYRLALHTQIMGM